MAKKRTETTSKKVAKRTKPARKAPAKKALNKTARRSPNTAMRPTPRTGAAFHTMGLAAGSCLTMAEADVIVQAAIPGGPHDIDSTLEDAGLISDNARRVFREEVANGVRDKGCSISRDDVPNASSNTLRDVRTAIKANASPA